MSWVMLYVKWGLPPVLGVLFVVGGNRWHRRRDST